MSTAHYQTTQGNENLGPQAGPIRPSFLEDFGKQSPILKNQSETNVHEPNLILLKNRDALAQRRKDLQAQAHGTYEDHAILRTKVINYEKEIAQLKSSNDALAKENQDLKHGMVQAHPTILPELEELRKSQGLMKANYDAAMKAFKKMKKENKKLKKMLFRMGVQYQESEEEEEEQQQPAVVITDQARGHGKEEKKEKKRNKFRKGPQPPVPPVPQVQPVQPLMSLGFSSKPFILKADDASGKLVKVDVNHQTDVAKVVQPPGATQTGVFASIPAPVPHTAPTAGTVVAHPVHAAPIQGHPAILPAPKQFPMQYPTPQMTATHLYNSGIQAAGFQSPRVQQVGGLAQVNCGNYMVPKATISFGQLAGKAPMTQVYGSPAYVKK